jgi:hypothetical protein
MKPDASATVPKVVPMLDASEGHCAHAVSVASNGGRSIPSFVSQAIFETFLFASPYHQGL